MKQNLHISHVRRMERMRVISDAITIWYNRDQTQISSDMECLLNSADNSKIKNKQLYI